MTETMKRLAGELAEIRCRWVDRFNHYERIRELKLAKIFDQRFRETADLQSTLEKLAAKEESDADKT